MKFIYCLIIASVVLHSLVAMDSVIKFDPEQLMASVVNLEKETDLEKIKNSWHTISEIITKNKSEIIAKEKYTHELAIALSGLEDPIDDLVDELSFEDYEMYKECRKIPDDIYEVGEELMKYVHIPQEKSGFYLAGK